MAGEKEENSRTAALTLLRHLRRVDEECGAGKSRIAFDVALALFERDRPEEMSVDQLAEATGYSRPAIRLVLERSIKFGSVEARTKTGETRCYGLTDHGRDKFEGYVRALLAFRNARSQSS